MGTVTNFERGLRAPISRVLNAWGNCPAAALHPCDCPADLNADGIVNAADLMQVIVSWVGK